MLATLVLLACLRHAASYTWPDTETDELERLFYENGGDFDTPGLGIPVCSAIPGDRPPFNGRTHAAEWLRTAYHDMATADVAAGVGGIDASIGFESTRAENPGLAFSETLDFFTVFQSKRASMSDLIAMGAILSLGVCSDGGVNIPMRGGRVDATEAGPPGVPEPQQDLASHTASFVKQGFNTEEMIGLVACGHTLGGVHGNDFPEIAPQLQNPNMDDNRQNFDATMDVFDNSVAKQFVNNETQNPLAFGHNETTNSDARIFRADGGSMISRMAKDNSFFLSTCTKLMDRMLNTVSKKVKLSEPIAPRAVKPRFLRIDVNTDNNTLTLAGSIRIMNDKRTSTKRSVFLDFQPRNSTTCKAANCHYSVEAKQTDESQTWPGLYKGMPSFVEYMFSTTIPVSVGVSAFNVRLVDGKTVVTEKNGGSGFPWNDALQPQLERSCIGFPDEQNNGWRNVTVAVRDDANIKDLTLSFTAAALQDGGLFPKLEIKNSSMVKSALFAPGSGYTFYHGGYFQVANRYSTIMKGLRYDVIGSGPKGVAVSSTFNSVDKFGDLDEC